MQIATVITTSVLAACGVGLWTYAGSALAENKALDYTPNPLGIKMSPYGQVIAMAIQAPIDNDWHASRGQQHHDHDHDCATEGCSHDHHVAHAHDDHDCGHEGCSHGHDHDDHDCGHEGCSHDHHHHASHDDHACTHEGCTHDHAEEQPRSSSKRPLMARLNAAVSERTNPRPPSAAHSFYLRRETEKRLHFGWSLDPSNYANYHAYHLFLSESSLGTREALREGWIEHGLKVARFTIDYCLREDHDPRPSLTAAVAASNALELMFYQKDTRPIAEFRQMLATLDHALAKHAELSNAWVGSGAWANLSPMRQQEVADRFAFLTKMREANAEAIKILAERGARSAEFPPSKSESQATARISISPPATGH